VFTTAQLERYSRQIVLPEVGGSGQARLADASVLVIGAGGLGSPALLYLAAAGVGRLGVVDDDVVELSNLHRQVLHATADVGRAKVDSAAERLTALNSGVTVEPLPVRLGPGNAHDVMKGYDVVLDGSDTFPTRYLVSDTCVELGTPLVYGALSRFAGHVSVLAGGTAPCYRCLFPTPPPRGAVPTCAEVGVIGPLAGVIGSIMATEALRLLLGGFGPNDDHAVERRDSGEQHGLAGRLLVVDLYAPEVTTFELARDPECAVCGPNATIDGPIDYEQFCGTAPA